MTTEKPKPRDWSELTESEKQRHADDEWAVVKKYRIGDPPA